MPSSLDMRSGPVQRVFATPELLRRILTSSSDLKFRKLLSVNHDFLSIITSVITSSRSIDYACVKAISGDETIYSLIRGQILSVAVKGLLGAVEDDTDPLGQMTVIAFHLEELLDWCPNLRQVRSAEAHAAFPQWLIKCRDRTISTCEIVRPREGVDVSLQATGPMSSFGEAYKGYRQYTVQVAQNDLGPAALKWLARLVLNEFVVHMNIRIPFQADAESLAALITALQPGNLHTEVDITAHPAYGGTTVTYRRLGKPFDDVIPRGFHESVTYPARRLSNWVQLEVFDLNERWPILPSLYTLARHIGHRLNAIELHVAIDGSAISIYSLHELVHLVKSALPVLREMLVEVDCTLYMDGDDDEEVPLSQHAWSGGQLEVVELSLWIGDPLKWQTVPYYAIAHNLACVLKEDGHVCLELAVPSDADGIEPATARDPSLDADLTTLTRWLIGLSPSRQEAIRAIGLREISEQLLGLRGSFSPYDIEFDDNDEPIPIRQSLLAKEVRHLRHRATLGKDASAKRELRHLRELILESGPLD